MLPTWVSVFSYFLFVCTWIQAGEESKPWLCVSFGDIHEVSTYIAPELVNSKLVNCRQSAVWSKQ